ncbi:MAG TPA: hypothetical protein VN842_05485 [Thermoplasmata archaeon]|nr:hypothetical protein [Thermoplasmata archaeon]
MSQDAATAYHGFPTKRSLLGELRTRIVATVGLLTGGLAFAVLFLAFFATKFAWYQNLAILLVDLMVVPAVLIVMWISWGVGIGRRFHDGF